MPYIDNADETLAHLELSYKTKVLRRLESWGHDDEALEAHRSLLDSARSLPHQEIENLRGTPEGDAVADTIIKIQRLHHLARPVSAGGWRKIARIALAASLSLGGWLLGLEYSFPIGGLFGASLGFAASIVIGRQWLGGMPERRHAIAALTSPTARRRWALVGAEVGPSPAEISLGRLE
jgi:hypothetical protein